MCGAATHVHDAEFRAHIVMCEERWKRLDERWNEQKDDFRRIESKINHFMWLLIASFMSLVVAAATAVLSGSVSIGS